MVEYVLILTMSKFWNDGGLAITSVPGFATKQECLNAGNAWLQNASKAHANTWTSAVCVPRSAQPQEAKP